MGADNPTHTYVTTFEVTRYPVRQEIARAVGQLRGLPDGGLERERVIIDGDWLMILWITQKPEVKK